MNHKYIKYFFFFLCLISVNLYAALQAEVDRNTIYMGESFQLTLHGGQLGGQDAPDIRALQNNFDILSSGQSSQVLISAGKSFTDTLWLYVLSPKHAGDITIPAIRIGKDKTNPIMIHVKTNNSSKSTTIQPDNRHVFMTSTIEPKSAYVQSQAVYKAIIYYDRNIENPKLSEPHAKNITFIHLGNDKNYKKIINGKPYQVYEVNFAMFPQKSGAIKIKSPIFVGNAMNNTAGKYFSNMWQPFRISAEDVVIDVKSIPKNAKTNWWLPAKTISVKTSWSNMPDKLTVGTPITRTITIHGEDVLANQLPQLMPTKLEGFQIYQDKADTKTTTDGKQIYAYRKEKAAFIPNKAGDYIIPAIDIHWWNTDTNQAEVTTIPAKKIHVIAANSVTNPVKTTPTALSSPIQVTKSMPSNMTTHDVLPISEKQSTPIWLDKWFWLANIMLLLWIITLILLWRKSNKKANSMPITNQAHAKKIESIRIARQAVKTAVQKNDIIAFKTALITFANKSWPHHQCLSIGDIIERIDDDEAVDALSLLDAYIYKDKSTQLDLLALWKKIEKSFILKKDKSDGDVLPKMY